LLGSAEFKKAERPRRRQREKSEEKTLNYTQNRKCKQLKKQHIICEKPVYELRALVLCEQKMFLANA